MNGKYLSLNDHVCNFISEQIFSGNMSPGERINENLLSKELNVSRTPIREALIQLSSDGLIDKVPRKGFYIKKLSIEKAREIYEVIGTLEAEAACKAMDNMDEEAIKRMSQIYEQLCISIKYRDLRAYKDLQKDFHGVYIERCGNNTLKAFIEHLKFSISLQTFYSEEIDKVFNIFGLYNEDHKLIIKYFEDKNKEELVKLLKEKHWVIKFTDVIS